MAEAVAQRYFLFLQNSQKKHLWQSLFHYQSCKLEAATFIKKDTSTQMSTCESGETFKNTHFVEYP